MSEEMSAPAPNDASASSVSKAAAAASSSSSPAAAPPAKARSDSEDDEKPAPSAADASSASDSGPREYVLPIRPRMRPMLGAGKKKKKSEDDDDDGNDGGAPAPGLLAQTGTLDSSVPGRSSISKTPESHELLAPTLLFPTSLFAEAKIAFVAASPTSCHSVAIASDGRAYGWGRNETGQLGLGFSSACVPTPTLLSAGNDDDVKFVGAAVGKYHTVLVGDDGLAYASGGNLCGQLGINNANSRGIDKFRRCVVMGQVAGGSGSSSGGGAGDDDDDGEDGDGNGNNEGGVRIVQASCGESVSALLSSAGHLYTAGSAEFGQLGNGETGEHIVSAGKLGYANCAKFVRRSEFVQSEGDAAAAGGIGSGMMTGKGVGSDGKVKCVRLEDSGRIRLANVTCGKNHFAAVEAPTRGNSRHVPRVFSWGCGDYGCLGHGVQADEYTPRLVASYRGPMFANNHPASAVAGSNCTLVLTRNGHVYYVGKHKTAGEATMRPTVVDALANNGHVVTAVGAGAQTVFCSTKSGVTVSWGNGSHGELGYGAGENKSSSKPKFVNGLDSCLVTSVACGMGHTLFVIRDDDEEDAKALKKVDKVEEVDVAEFVEKIKAKKSSEDDGEPAKKKQKGKGKK